MRALFLLVFSFVALIGSARCSAPGDVYAYECGSVPCVNYSLKKTYNASNFFSAFKFEDSYDKWTKGFARYVSKEEAMASGLAKIDNNRVYLGVDSNNVADTGNGGQEGRRSVRLENKDSFSEGLLIADFAHIPGNACGMWPAYWLHRDETGKGKGYSEIDIIENVSLQEENEITMYTKLAPCDMKPDTGSMSGKVRHGKCTWNTRRKRKDTQSHGCGVSADSSFGNKFNERGGGVWALLVDSSGIKIWYFDRDSVPDDIGRGIPKPDGWEVKPVMNFAPRKCNVKEAWKKMNIMINITFCGSYAGSPSWEGFTGCKQRTKYDTCIDYVANNPSAFEDVYFLINSIKVFKKV